jgi:hypothetical protein
MKQHMGKSYLLLPLGLVLSASEMIGARYIAMPDFIKGLWVGVGLGLMVLSFIARKKGFSSN